MATTHPRVFARGTRTVGSTAGAIVYAPDPRRRRWIADELGKRDVLFRTCDIREVLQALVEAPAPRPQMLIADFDTMSVGELFELHALREGGWFGTIIALGSVTPALAHSLKIDRIVRPPLYEDLLCDVIDGLGLHDVTSPIPVITGSTSS